MHDLRLIRDNPEAFDAALKRRDLAPLSAGLRDLDRRRRAAVTESEQAQARRKALSKQIGVARGKGEPTDTLMAEVNGLDQVQKVAEKSAADAEAELDGVLAGIPNLPAADVPDGEDERDNKEIRRVGNPRNFAFDPQDHVMIGEGLGLMDFAAAAKLSGARFVVLKGQLARLERALAQFMLDLHTSPANGALGGYTEVDPPLLVRDEAMFGTGQLPKFREDQFMSTSMASRDKLLRDAINHRPACTAIDLELLRQGKIDLATLVERVLERAPTKEDLWLIPTAEVALTNLVRETILDEKELPLRYTAWTPCFRSEAGAAGKDTRGMIRQHQFPKVEMVSITTPEQSEAEHERMTGCAEEVLKRLGLAFRTVVLCAGDMGFSARKTYDIEVWLPGQNAYREISSCSNCGDFQARRMNARFRPREGKGTRFVHTLNGSGLAVGRTLIAVLENYQNADGTVAVPEALRSYMGGVEQIPAARG